MASILVAMSGGVDSTVAAAQLVEAGHDVTGVHLKLADLPHHEQVVGHGCCTLDDAQDARRAAQLLGIPYYVWDMTTAFHDEVQQPFAQAYARGQTPNPCVTCNERVKYAALLERATTLGFDALATGHHARLERGGKPVEQPGPGVSLRRARDRAKDQTYVLYMATAYQLAHTLLPIGELTKAQVREEAQRFGFRVANKPDSYDVCFIPDRDTAGYLSRKLGSQPGNVVDLDEHVIGEHQGVWNFTIGQRRGLGLHTAWTHGGKPQRRFVVDIDADTATVRVGPREALACHWAEITATNWIEGEMPDEGLVQVRAHARPVPAHLSATSANGVRIDFHEPVFGLAYGQAAVVYDHRDERCLGGGRIAVADRAAALPVLAAKRAAE